MKEILFISSALQQPRHQKRIDLFRKNFRLTVLYFSRNKYKVNIKNYAAESIEIGVAKDGSYGSRIFLLLKLWSLLWRSSSEVVYCTGPDQALIAILARKKVYLELGDLYQLDGRGKLFAVLDGFFCRKLAGLILTSPYYLSAYYAKKWPQIVSKSVVIENKLPIRMKADVDNFRRLLSRENRAGRIRIGVIGNFVFRKPLEALAELLRRRADIELHAYGDGLVSIFQGLQNFTYHGAFRSPEDLPEIYASIDVNYILYDASNNNVKLALPNKLYESIAFGCPVICSDGVALGMLVKEKGFGIASSIDDLEKSLDQLVVDYEMYRGRLLSEPEASYLDMQQEEILSLIK